ncbi:MAG: type II toxin-antitoxin system HigB family toxin [Bdellovibrionota bacterium]
MQLLGKGIIDKFKVKHANSRKALDKWQTAIEKSKARNFVELKQTFPSADLVGSAMVFDVGGNKVRVISVVRFEIQQLLVTHVLTHAEYDRNKW